MTPIEKIEHLAQNAKHRPDPAQAVSELAQAVADALKERTQAFVKAVAKERTQAFVKAVAKTPAKRK